MRREVCFECGGLVQNDGRCECFEPSKGVSLIGESTPAPWQAVKSEDAYCVASTSGGWMVVSTTADPNKFCPEADARLIAAAPELLSELEYRYAQGLCGCEHPACNRCEDDRQTLAVINKAKGEIE